MEQRPGGTADEPLGFSFDADHTARDPDELVALLGGKGAGLVTMVGLGLPVPPGFTLTTEASRRYRAAGWDDALDLAVRAGVAEIETLTGRRLGDPERPLLVSVRSGAAVSMPGMLDSVLDVGITDDVVAALAETTGDHAFAADTHRRALLNHAAVVGGASDPVLAAAGAASDVDGVRAVLARAGIAMADDPHQQIVAAIGAVFESWNTARAVGYRDVEGLGDAGDSAATVQQMVFGNLGDRSGTGVAFTRDPSTGAPGLIGDFLIGAQGEDVVGGDHHTAPLGDLVQRWPDIGDELETFAGVLERHYRDMVDIEFTVEQGRLWILQARPGKRSPLATFRIAVDLAEDPHTPVDRSDAVTRCRPLLADPPTVASAGSRAPSAPTVVASGIAASPGVAVGVLSVDVEEAVRLAADGVDVILARPVTSPADVHGMHASRGLVTSTGGQVSHAAVIARSWGLPAVVGADMTVDADGVDGPGGRVAVGSLVTVDGDQGRLLLGAHRAERIVPPAVAIIRRWAGELDDELPDDELPGEPQPDHQPPAPPDEGGTPGSASGPAARRDDVDPFVALHVLRIKGMAPVATLAAMCGAAAGAVERLCHDLASAGLAVFNEGRDMWQLTPDGRDEHADRLAETVARLDVSAVRYDDFLVFDAECKAVCTAWQVRGDGRNDHADAAHDIGVIERLVALHTRARPVITSFSASLPWTAVYPSRLDGAIGRVRSGDGTAITGVLCDSYHDIWMELHEDLILTLGIDRTAEGRA